MIVPIPIILGSSFKIQPSPHVNYRQATFTEFKKQKYKKICQDIVRRLDERL